VSVLGCSPPTPSPHFGSLVVVFHRAPSLTTCAVSSSSRELRPLFRGLPARTRPKPLGPEHLPWGSIPLRDVSLRSPPHASIPKPAKFRPRSFSLPRRLSPPPALQVYFTPQPRPGFTLQGFPLLRSRTTFRWPLPSCRWVASPTKRLRTWRQIRGPAYRALLCTGVRCTTQGVSLRSTRSPPEFHLLQVLPPPAVRSPSRPLRSWPLLPGPSS
jgi:hypothetical protein